MNADQSTGEIVVVSGSYGAGHDAAADALALQLRSAGHVVRRLDVAIELPWRVGAVLRWLYFMQLRFMPSTWGTTLAQLEQEGVAFRVVRRGLGLLGRRLVQQVATARVVISTHPFASQALGEARASGALDVPVVTYLTDASVHRLWIHPSVDLHLAIHAVTAAQSRALGGRTRVVSPVVARRGTAPTGWVPPWPSDRPAALVVGGSCGVGDLEASAVDLLTTGLVTPVVACGTNARLQQRLAAVPGIVALGWRDDMDALVGAAGCVIQNAGGMTSLESLSAGTPTLTYRPIPGHGMTNARALDSAGMVPWITDRTDLAPALQRALISPKSFGLPHDAPSVLDELARPLLVAASTALIAAA